MDKSNIAIPKARNSKELSFHEEWSRVSRFNGCLSDESDEESNSSVLTVNATKLDRNHKSLSDDCDAVQVKATKTTVSLVNEVDVLSLRKNQSLPNLDGNDYVNISVMNGQKFVSVTQKNGDVKEFIFGDRKRKYIVEDEYEESEIHKLRRKAKKAKKTSRVDFATTKRRTIDFSLDI